MIKLMFNILTGVPLLVYKTLSLVLCTVIKILTTFVSLVVSGLYNILLMLISFKKLILLILGLALSVFVASNYLNIF